MAMEAGGQKPSSSIEVMTGWVGRRRQRRKQMAPASQRGAGVQDAHGGRGRAVSPDDVVLRAVNIVEGF